MKREPEKEAGANITRGRVVVRSIFYPDFSFVENWKEELQRRL